MKVKSDENRLSLASPALYRIRVPSHISHDWTEWSAHMTHENDRDGEPVTAISGTYDQAALHGLLRRLYSLGLPLLSVQCLEVTQKTQNLSSMDGSNDTPPTS